MNEEFVALQGLIKASSVMSTIVLSAGYVVAFVRQTVRDLVAACVGQVVQIVIEVLATGGIALPVAIVQVVAAVAQYAAKVVTHMRALVRSLHNLVGLVRNFGETFRALVQLIKLLARDERGAIGHVPRKELPRKPPRYTAEEVQQIVDGIRAEETAQPANTLPRGVAGQKAIYGEQGMGFHYSEQ
jgi:hypothetical protein